MKKYFALIGSLLLLFSNICFAETPKIQLDFTGKNFNSHHYHIDLVNGDLLLKRDNQLILTKSTLTQNIENFSVNDIRKINNGFIIKANWGGGEYFYNTQFYFNFNKHQDNFYLSKIDECMLSNATDEKKILYYL